MLHGVCVARRASGQGIAARALSDVLARLAQGCVRKVSASYFADNTHIRGCLQALGFLDEGYLVAQTTRHGVPVDMYLVAKFLKGQG
jgi:RimJ/RimL family protein N-acetyltransferase